MNVSIASGATGTLWMIVCAPQAIFNVFVRNELGATSAQLGILVGLLSLASVFQLAAILIYRHLPRRKAFWIITSVIHRLNGPVLAVVAFRAASGADPQTGFRILAAAMIVSWVLTNISSSGWWEWMADLVPISVRARFFGRRSAVSQSVNIVAFFLTTVVLDAAVGPGRFFVYGVVFLVGGAGGVLDILLHLLIPEPSRTPRQAAGTPGASPDVESASGGWFTKPLGNRNFRRFSLATGLVLFAINIAAPFFAPYITDPTAIGAPATWLGIMFVISQLTWIAVSPAWGTIMDRFGRKPAVMIGLLFTLSWIGYIVLRPSNYTVVLPMIALVGGLLAPAFWDGINQLMLSLTPSRDRLTYIAWYWTIIGSISAGGSLVGGRLDDRLRGSSFQVLGTELMGFHTVVLSSLLLVGLSLLVLARIDEGPVRPLSYVFSRVASPGIFKTFLNIGVLARADDSERAVRTLRAIDSASDDLAVEHVIDRLGDPDADVREEAVRALGRLRSLEARDALIDVLLDPDATNRVAAARALGRIGDRRALPFLIDAMDGGSDELREACAVAMGEIGGDDSVRLLVDLLRGDRSDRVAAGSATALSRLGGFEAAWEIVPRLHRTANPVLRSQLAIALANVLGRPGEFYRHVTGNADQQTTRRRRLIQEAIKGLPRVVPGIEDELGAVSRHVTEMNYRSALATLQNGVRRILATRAGLPEEPWLDVLRATYERDPRLAVWYWFVEQTSRLERGTRDEGVERMEFLIACYFVKSRLTTG